MINNFRKLYIAGLTLFTAVIVNAQWEGDDDINLPPPTEGEGAQANPIDMYSMILFGISILMIVGYVYYAKTKNKRIS